MQGSPYSVPPGLLGELAQFIYSAAPRPVPEIALAGAMGLMAGIVGRAYNVSGAGLNLYVLLLAPTGTGKEGIASGISALMKSIRRTVPASVEFVGPAAIASPQALVKYLANTSQSFVSILGEFGLTMQQMANPKAPSHLVGLRQVLLDLYAKSGRNGELRPSIYSDKEKNTVTVQSPAFSVVGESTPESFYSNLSERLIADGLLPRFTTIEYRGNRPKLNEDRPESPKPAVVEQLATLCTHALNLNNQKIAVDVTQSAAARAMFDEFNTECDERINSATTEVTRHLWNRAHLKSLKLAALVAVGVNPYDPTITSEYALWAIQIEKTNVRNLLARFETGEVGEQASSESAQQNKVREVIRTWLTKSWSDLKRYNVGTAQIHDDKVIPYSYISKRLTNDVIFRDSKIGATATIKKTVEEIIKCGELVRLSPMEVDKSYQTRMECYGVSNPHAILDAGAKREPSNF